MNRTSQYRGRRDAGGSAHGALVQALARSCAGPVMWWVTTAERKPDAQQRATRFADRGRALAFLKERIAEGLWARMSEARGPA